MKSSSPQVRPHSHVYNKELVRKLCRLKQKDNITQADYDWLYPTAENVPRIYCTPKIHKTGNPLRQIVDRLYRVHISGSD